ncbi:SUKH-4 family immunity protein [Micromonospora sp. MS34]|uniref:SUKH-4 family immunity protein n=1 Tax=Micromonospora sp. MS34 TaxID=3385971 RepID=UPI0039A04660
MPDYVRWSPDQAGVLLHEGARAFLVEEGLPRRSLLFQAAGPTGHPMEVRSGHVCVVLGAYDEGELFLLDIEQGRILFGAEGFNDASPVNASLELFAQCLAVTEGNFPYYSSGDGNAKFLAVAKRLEQVLSAIDPGTYRLRGSFWKTFVHDVSIGDFSIEDVDWWPPDSDR